MKIGVALPQAGAWATKDAIVEVAVVAEREGFSSLWVCERLLMPTATKSRYYGRADGRVPPIEARILDPLAALTLASTVTVRVKLGTSVLCMLWRPPVILAKQLATLDVFSRGRVHAGLGLGWLDEEFVATGVERSDLGQRAEEYLDCLDLLCAARSPVVYQGRFYTLPPCTTGPKPIQHRLERSLGGFSEAAIRRAALRSNALNIGQVSLDKATAIVKRYRAHGGSYAIARLTNRVNVRDALLRYRDSGIDEVFIDENFNPAGPATKTLFKSMESLLDCQGA
jgi:alkanesulfonate monooxygenase SsuD/methylene tetrahydromethanopterin reductase-like flavin-dependent oxidoreductase (luciferase family)